MTTTERRQLIFDLLRDDLGSKSISIWTAYAVIAWCNDPRRDPPLDRAGPCAIVRRWQRQRAAESLAGMAERLGYEVAP